MSDPTRRNVLLGGSAVLLLTTTGGCNSQEPWQLVEMEDRLRPLAFDMISANEGKAVTAERYRGKVVVLEFGFTSCPDVCPLTLSALTKALKNIGDSAKDVVVLFVTVDPDRDTPDVLKQYVENFAPQVTGLRGTPNQLATLARRYRIAYSVTPAPNPQDIEVVHTPTLFIFDRTGKLRLLSPTIKDTGPMEHDLKALVAEA